MLREDAADSIAELSFVPRWNGRKKAQKAQNKKVFRHRRRSLFLQRRMRSTDFRDAGTINFAPFAPFRGQPEMIVCSQLSASFHFNTGVQSAHDPSVRPHWLQVLTIGRRPKTTLIRIAVLVATCFVTFRFVLVPIRIDGISMQPTYHTGQINCVNRLAYLRHEPQRGDIVSVRFSKPEGIANPSQMLLKRIIGLPGETVAFHGGHVYINGQLLDEPYLKKPCDWEHEPVQCGQDQYYIVGDNRSMPFELHTQGRAERDRIIGKILL
jgi:signal peptidase I